MDGKVDADAAPAIDRHKGASGQLCNLGRWQGDEQLIFLGSPAPRVPLWNYAGVGDAEALPLGAHSRDEAVKGNEALPLLLPPRSGQRRAFSAWVPKQPA
jgi:hypothetical protein